GSRPPDVAPLAPGRGPPGPSGPRSCPRRPVRQHLRERASARLLQGVAPLAVDRDEPPGEWCQGGRASGRSSAVGQHQRRAERGLHPADAAEAGPIAHAGRLTALPDGAGPLDALEQLDVAGSQQELAVEREPALHTGGHAVRKPRRGSGCHGTVGSGSASKIHGRRSATGRYIFLLPTTQGLWLISSASNIPVPRNEPVLSYAPGSAERAALKAALGAVGGERADIPVVIGGEEVRG